MQHHAHLRLHPGGRGRAGVGARFISPFPGRIKDWHSANGGAPTYEPRDDPGVVCVSRMYAYYKTHGHEKTICMPTARGRRRAARAAAFATDEIAALPASTA